MKSGFEAIPDKWLGVISSHLMAFDNETSQSSHLHIRDSLQYVYPAVIFFYVVVIFLGTGSNSATLVFIFRLRLFRDPTILLISNHVVANLVMCLIVLPISLTTILLEKWALGKFMCYFLPMLQDIPFHVSSLTFLLISVDRYICILHPTKPRLHAFVCSLGCWFVATCVVIPYAFDMIYFDLSIFGPRYDGAAICAVDVDAGMDRYVQGIFVTFYAIPMILALILHIRVTLKIKDQIASQENREQFGIINSILETSFSDVNRAISPPLPTAIDQSSNAFSDHNFHPFQEKRTQKYLLIMALLFLLYLCPIKVLQLFKYVSYGTYDNTHPFDVSYTTLVLLTFLPTCTTPALFGSWTLKMPIMDRINSYFWLNKRGLPAGQQISSIQFASTV